MDMRRTPRRLGAGAAGLAVLLALGACGSGRWWSGGPAAPTPGASGGPGALTVLIASSGPAETDAVTGAVAAWSGVVGVGATVRVASDLGTELSAGFASGRPADVFPVPADSFPSLAANGSLVPYGTRLRAVSDFYPSLVREYTWQGTLYCAPGDFSTLALVINTDDWAAAGLTDADLPTTWDQLAAVAKRLTTAGRVGLALDARYARLGVFLAEAGGAMTSADGTTATVDSQANLTALQYVKDRLTDGSFAFASSLGAASGVEAFGTNKAAMTIEGTGITGAMEADHPGVGYRVVELPAGPGGKATLEFSSCWGVAAESANQNAAVDLAQYLAATDRQTGFAKEFGAMPSVQSAAAAFMAQVPQAKAFVASAGFARSAVVAPRAAPVVADFDSQLQGLASADPQAILASIQGKLQAVLAPGP